MMETKLQAYIRQSLFSEYNEFAFKVLGQDLFLKHREEIHSFIQGRVNLIYAKIMMEEYKDSEISFLLENIKKREEVDESNSNS